MVVGIWILFILSFLGLGSLIESKQLVCQASTDKRKKICYYTKNQSFFQFQSCQQTICIADGKGGCQQTTFNYNEEECLREICHFEPYQGSIERCIVQLRKTQSDFVSNIEEILITGLVIFILVSIALQIKHCLCSRDPSSGQQFDEQDEEQLQSWNSQPQNGFVSITSESDPILLVQREKTKRKRFLAKIKVKQSQTDLNLGFINSQNTMNNNIIDQENQMCCICLSQGHINCKTICGHLYHSKCLVDWLKLKPFCPSCRNKNFSPVKIFCTNCKKIRDIFRIYKKTYVGYSRIGEEYFHTFGTCIECVESYPQLRNSPIPLNS